MQLQDAYKVEGVPALGIAGRYYTDGSLAGSMERALQVADYLIAEVRKSQVSATAAVGSTGPPRRASFVRHGPANRRQAGLQWPARFVPL